MKTVEINGKRYEPVEVALDCVCELCAFSGDNCFANGAMAACSRLDEDLPSEHFMIFKEATNNDKD